MSNQQQKNIESPIKKIIDNGINSKEVEQLQNALSDENIKNDLETKLNNELSNYLKNLENSTTLTSLITAVENAMKNNNPPKDLSLYQTLLNTLQSFETTPNQNNTNNAETKPETLDILNTKRTKETAKKAMEHNEDQFNALFQAVQDNDNQDKLKQFVINYSLKNKNITEIKSITAVTAKSDDENFPQGVKYLGIESSNTENNEIFSF
ncbi:MAG: hypothetical protein GXP45_08290 [bacterium]|nr:hypothetical protein [bacterium]